MRELRRGPAQFAGLVEGEQANDLEPLIERHGDEPVRRLTKAHVDEFVTDLLVGGTKTGKGRTRRPWEAIA